MRVPSLAIALLLSSLTIAGCIAPGDEEDDGRLREPAFTDVEHKEETTLEIPVATSVHPQKTDLPNEADVTLPERSRNLTLTPSWTQALNAFEVVIERPDGRTDTVDLGDEPRPITYDTPVAGTFILRLRAQGFVQEDTVTIAATYVWFERVYAGDLPSGEPIGGVSLARDGDLWKATLVSKASGAAKSFDLATASGDIHLSTVDDENATSHITVQAWASDKEAARAAVLEVIITNTVRNGQLRSHVGWPAGCCGDEVRRSTEIDAILPADSEGVATASSGSIAATDASLTALDVTTSSGDIGLTGSVGRLSASSSSGHISGRIIAIGDIGLSTSSGDVALKLHAARSLLLTAASSSGSIVLTLTEGPGIAYGLDLATSSGSFTEEMGEAELEYPDADNKDRARLVTLNGDGRGIQVTGSVSTSSGDQEFISA